MYLSNQTVLEASEFLRDETRIDYAAFGLLFIFKNSLDRITQNSKIVFDRSAVSRDLHRNFSFLDESNNDSEKSKYFLSEDYITKSAKSFFKNHGKADLLSVAIICLQQYNFTEKPDEEKLAEVFAKTFNLCDEIIVSWFDKKSTIKLYFSNDLNLKERKDFLWDKLKVKPEHKSLSFNENNGIDSNAGDWSRSGYLQRFTPSSFSKEFIFIPSSKLQEIATQEISNTAPKKQTEKSTPEDLNMLFFGPAGSGKSYIAREELLRKGIVTDNTIEIVFHPDYSYGEFLGTLRPKVLYKKTNAHQNIKILSHPKATDSIIDGLEPIISYQFIAGPLLLIIEKALSKPQEKFAILIDELNRGNVPEILGDIFNCLDRSHLYKSSGNIEAIEYLNSCGHSVDALFLPDNLHIYATINSSDQNIYPLDTAFKRRWNWQHVDINYNHSACLNWQITFSQTTFKWLEFIQVINNFITTTLELPEDKQIGQFFINKTANNSSVRDTEKLLKYFWDDIPLHKRALFFNNHIKSYRLLKEANESSRIDLLFAPALIELLENIK